MQQVASKGMEDVWCACESWIDVAMSMAPQTKGVLDQALQAYGRGELPAQVFT